MKSGILAKEIKEILNIHLDGLIEEVIIFGSRIKRTARTDSDYDVLIILKGNDTREIRRKISDLCYDLDLKYDIFLDTQVITLDEINYGIWGKHPVFMDAIKEGVHA
jgi:predicted nucleotidyltransferase